jgi:hypothetical protein
VLTDQERFLVLSRHGLRVIYEVSIRNISFDSKTEYQTNEIALLIKVIPSLN